MILNHSVISEMTGRASGPGLTEGPDQRSGILVNALPPPLSVMKPSIFYWGG